MSLAGQVKQFSTPAMNKEAGKWDRRLVDLLLKRFPGAFQSSGNLEQALRTVSPSPTVTRALIPTKFTAGMQSPISGIINPKLLGTAPIRQPVESLPTRAQDIIYANKSVSPLLKSGPIFDEVVSRRLKVFDEPATAAPFPLNNVSNASINRAREALVTQPVPMPKELQFVNYYGKPDKTINEAILTPRSARTITFPFNPDMSEYPAISSIQGHKRLFKGFQDPTQVEGLLDKSQVDQINPFLFSSGYPDVASVHARYGLGFVMPIRVNKLPREPIYTPHMMSIDDTERLANPGDRHRWDAWDRRSHYETITPANDIRNASTRNGYTPQINKDNNTVTLQPVRFEGVKKTVIPGYPETFATMRRNYSDSVGDYVNLAQGRILNQHPAFDASQVQNAARRAINEQRNNEFLQMRLKNIQPPVAPPTGLWDSFKHYLPSFGS